MVVDFSKLDNNKDFVEKYYKSTSREWNNTYENLNINGVPVEIYVQDIDSEIDSRRVYSLMDNKWLKKTDKSKINDANIDSGKIKSTVADIENHYWQYGNEHITIQTIIQSCKDDKQADRQSYQSKKKGLSRKEMDGNQYNL